jgi:hypothetical protein
MTLNSPGKGSFALTTQLCSRPRTRIGCGRIAKHGRYIRGLRVRWRPLVDIASAYEAYIQLTGLEIDLNDLKTDEELYWRRDNSGSSTSSGFAAIDHVLDGANNDVADDIEFLDDFDTI